MSEGKQYIYTGKAGEHRVMSELLLRGYDVAKLDMGIGADLILLDGRIIEVKTCSNWSMNRNSRIYHFNFNYQYRHKNKTYAKQINADFLILWCIADDIFYIIPMSEILSNLTGLSVFPDSPTSKYSFYKNNWGILKLEDK